jgi:hypothetical protein
MVLAVKGVALFQSGPGHALLRVRDFGPFAPIALAAFQN